MFGVVFLLLECSFVRCAWCSVVCVVVCVLFVLLLMWLCFFGCCWCGLLHRNNKKHHNKSNVGVFGWYGLFVCCV